MADVFTKKIRSRIMSRIKGKNTKPELALKKELSKKGVKYSSSYRFKELNFRPDIVIKSKKTCIFIDGCFWHKCPKCFKMPKSNKKYWAPKINRNVQRDKEQNAYLKKNGWNVIRIWEHEIKDNLERTVKKVCSLLKKSPH